MAVLAIAAIVVAFFVLPKLLVRSDAALAASELLKARNDARLVIVQLLGGTLLLGGLVFTNRTLELSREGQIADRYNSAIEHLGHADQGVRAGGIYALERIAKFDEDSRASIMEILTSYLRLHSPYRPRISEYGFPSVGDSIGFPPSPDIQAAATVLSRRTYGGILDLSYVDLQRAYLPKADLRGARLRGTNLAYADLREANLEGADLRGAVLSSAIMGHANLAGAYLSRAALQRTFLEEANLRKAVLELADLLGASLVKADLQQTNFFWAYLYESALQGADLRGAYLLGSCGLSEEQVKTALTNGQTRLPIPSSNVSCPQ